MVACSKLVTVKERRWGLLYILKVESIGYDDSLDVGCERKKSKGRCHGLSLEQLSG